MAQSFRIEVEYRLLDRSGGDIGRLDGVRRGSGSVSRSANASIKASASIDLIDRSQVEDWTQVRVQPVLTVNGDVWPLGVFLPDVPEWSHSDVSRSGTIDLLDKTTILDGDSFGQTFGVAKGKNVVDAVRDIISSTGEPPSGVEDSTEKLRSGIEWDPDATKLQVVNDLLDAGNFFSLYTSGRGRFVAEPYVKPAYRPVMAEFVDGENATIAGLYSPEFTIEHDIGKVPNKVIAISQADGDEEALRAVAENTDPESPFSFDNLGFWRTEVLTGVDTTSQSSLQSKADRTLINASSPQEKIVIEHPPYEVTVNDAVTFASRLHGIEGLYTVQKQEWDLAYDGLVSSTLRRVVDL